LITMSSLHLIYKDRERKKKTKERKNWESLAVP
jgi:hypothetical protein